MLLAQVMTGTTQTFLFLSKIAGQGEALGNALDASAEPACAMLTSGVTHPQVASKRTHMYHLGQMTKLFERAVGVEDGTPWLL